MVDGINSVLQCIGLLHGLRVIILYVRCMCEIVENLNLDKSMPA